ncbi:MAG: hypothetical protein AAGE61_16575 [Pseudomonadota bacterium]
MDAAFDLSGARVGRFTDHAQRRFEICGLFNITLFRKYEASSGNDFREIRHFFVNADHHYPTEGSTLFY